MDAYTLLLVIVVILFVRYYYQQPCTQHANTIKTLVKQTGRWITAARQDKEPMIAVLHANYAAGYWYAVRDIATDTDIAAATGIDVLKFQAAVQQTQEQATQAAFTRCPAFEPPNGLLR